ncbi:MAG TPA: hypothetical protein VJQ54_18140 [Candidatus Sulfotelmatobacter sp.]|nr:hypothetical protein [Candidatus Sulfotelmatobacter sp.]
MKTTLIVDFLAIITAFVGFYAAKLWLQSSKVRIVPAWAKYGGIEQGGGEAQSHGGWIAGIIEANEEAATLNQRAARWTAISVGLGAITTIVSALLTSG